MTHRTCPACAEPLSETASVEGIDPLRRTPDRYGVYVCARCGSGRTLPFVASAELGELYPSTYGPHGLPTNRGLKLATALLYRSRYWWALRRGGGLRSLGLARPGNLLDVGSGRGDLGVALTRRGWRVTGLEPSEDACVEARTRGVPTEHGTLTASGDRLPNGGYDVIVFHHSLEHVAEPEEDLTIAFRLLRPGGRLIVAVPNFTCWQRGPFGWYWAHLDLPRHRSHFSPHGLEVLLRRSGLSAIEITTTTSAEALPVSVQHRLHAGRRFAPGSLARLATTAVTFLLVPLTVALNRLRGGGDVLIADAVKPFDKV